MRSETAISLAMLALATRGKPLLGFRSDIVEQLQRLRAAGMDIHGLRIRPTVNGETSTEVSDFVGRMAITGLVVQESPIRLTNDGFEVLRNHIRRKSEDPTSRDELIRGATVLGIPSETFDEWIAPASLAA
jgi:hypothetical protein